MRSQFLKAAVIAALLLIPGAVNAQFGHPLKGQWSGEWGPKDKPKRLLLDMQWDGKAFTGSINPGDENAVVKTVTFDYANPSAWKVKIEAEDYYYGYYSKYYYGEGEGDADSGGAEGAAARGSN